MYTQKNMNNNNLSCATKGKQFIEAHRQKTLWLIKVLLKVLPSKASSQKHQVEVITFFTIVMFQALNT